jgi:predicted MFS family arabinose efflux permease
VSRAAVGTGSPRANPLVPIAAARLKPGYYLLTALATLGASYFFGYLFFYLRDRFGFGDRENLAVAAMHGAIYVVSAWQCGKFAERRGFHTSLRLGFGGLAVCMAAGALAPRAALAVGVIAIFSIVLLFIWPALEALVTEHEPPARVPHVIGWYNVMWSGAAAFAYFSGGSLYAWLGAGAVFWLPAAIFLAGFVVTRGLAGLAARVVPPEPILEAGPRPTEASVAVTSVPPETFLRLGWFANPFSFVAVFTLIALMPGLAEKFALRPEQIGLFCSVWLFGRLASFLWLWHWTGWHYSFRWLAGGYLLLVGSFVVVLIAPWLAVVMAAQVGFGIACGLLYYSSLFYSMDVGEARAELGGLHEAALGVGIFAGPAVGALSSHLFPDEAHASAVAVSGLLTAGFAALVGIWARARYGRARVPV